MTEPRFLLDTNICVYLLAGLSGVVRDRMEAMVPGEVVTSAIVFAEVMRGVDRTNRPAMDLIGRFFALIEVRPFDQVAADIYATLPFRRGRFDRLIGAHAVALDLTLVTNNEADFADIAGLRVENWTLPPA